MRSVKHIPPGGEKRQRHKLTEPDVSIHGSPTQNSEHPLKALNTRLKPYEALPTMEDETKV